MSMGLYKRNLTQSAVGLAIGGRHLELAQHPIIKALLVDKWNAFGKYFFIVDCCLYTIHLVVLSFAVYLRPTHTDCECNPSTVVENRCPTMTDVDTGAGWMDASDGQNINVYDFNEMDSCVRLISEVLLLVFGFLFAHKLWFKIRTTGCKSFFRVDPILNTLKIVHLVFLVLAAIMRVPFLCKWEYIPMIVVSVTSWFQYFFILRNISPRLGMLIVMVEKIIFQDLGRFLLIYFVMQVGFYEAYRVLLPHNWDLECTTSWTTPCPWFMKSDLNATELNLTITNTTDDMNWGNQTRTYGIPDWFGLLQSDIGDYLWNIQSIAILNILYAAHAILSTLVMMNLIIAMMGYTFSDVKDDDGKQFWILRSTLILQYEMNAVSFHRWRHFLERGGNNTGAYAPDGDWYRLIYYQETRRKKEKILF